MGWVDFTARLVKWRDQGLRSWLFALALFCLSLATRLALPPAVGRLPFLVFFPAIIIAALACGVAPGLGVLLLSALAGWFIVLAPVHPAHPSPGAILTLAAFLISGALLVAVVEGLAQAVAKAETLALANADLFKELQHRVANNFQIVAATLRKAQRSVIEPSARAAIETAVSRIQAMSEMHRRLYDAKSYSVGLEPVLAAVVAEVFGDVPVQVAIEIAPRELSIGEMTAITLLVNEAAINAAKHVFRQEKGGRFEVLLSETAPNRLQLLIRDDGPGIPREPPASDGRARFGFAVMRSLAEQLGGSLELPDTRGGVLRVEFTSESAP